jgi:hypothetical protein
MIPKDKALDLILDFKEGETSILEAKKNALKAIKIMLEHNKVLIISDYVKDKYLTYWNDVIFQINKL